MLTLVVFGMTTFSLMMRELMQPALILQYSQSIWYWVFLKVHNGFRSGGYEEGPWQSALLDILVFSSGCKALRCVCDHWACCSVNLHTKILTRRYSRSLENGVGVGGSALSRCSCSEAPEFSPLCFTANTVWVSISLQSQTSVNTFSSHLLENVRMSQPSPGRTGRLPLISLLIKWFRDWDLSFETTTM